MYWEQTDKLLKLKSTKRWCNVYILDSPENSKIPFLQRTNHSLINLRKCMQCQFCRYHSWIYYRIREMFCKFAMEHTEFFVSVKSQTNHRISQKDLLYLSLGNFFNKSEALPGIRGKSTVRFRKIAISSSPQETSKELPVQKLTTLKISLIDWRRLRKKN